MTARLLDGVALAKEVREALRPRVNALLAARGAPPHLAIVLVGNHPASEVYVRNKMRSGADIGIHVDLFRLEASASLDQILARVDALNRSLAVDGILVQSPLPKELGPGAERRVFDEIAPEKDVDGFHAINLGRLVQNQPALTPCTPQGIIRLLEHYAIDLARKHAVVIGRSDIVGKPMALMLLHRNATVTICHSQTRALKDHTTTADLIVAAVGRPAMLTPELVKPGAVVIDVGMNHLTSEKEVVSLFGADSCKHVEFLKKGSLLTGDVDPAVAEVASALTPVPGGVGPLTVAMLQQNTVAAAEMRPRG